MKTFLALFAVAFTLLGQSERRKPNPNSPNGCVDPVSDFFPWKKMAVRPVDKPIKTFNDLVEFLAPRLDGPNKVYDRGWQQLTPHWGIKPEELDVMYFAAQQGEMGSFHRELIQPCTVLADMMYDIPVKLLNKPILADWEDRQGKWAWVYRLNDRIELVFFQDCSNPTYRVSMLTGGSGENLTPGATPEPTPSPPSPTAPVDVCPDIPGLQLLIPPGMTLDPNTGKCVSLPSPPPTVVNVPPASPTPLEITNQHPIDNRVYVEPKVVVMPPQVQRVIITNKVPWHQAMYNITGSGFHVIAGAWLIHNWNFRVPGPQGAQGIQGIAGINGKDGTPGVNGKDGINGRDGSPGAPGPQGPGGPQGPPGTNGSNGGPGQQGPPGPPGQNSGPGPQGPPGQNGGLGPQGPPGQPGAQGQPGPQGPPGRDGAPGTCQVLTPSGLKPCGTSPPRP